jgi:hypothetical protein
MIAKEDVQAIEDVVDGNLPAPLDQVSPLLIALVAYPHCTLGHRR